MGEIIKVLLVEDDEDDYIIARDLLSEITRPRFTLDWVQNFDAGLKAMLQHQHDVVLVDYRLGARNGIELLRAAQERGCQAPVILLTGAGEHQVDIDAMQAGAADYLIKGQLQTHSLERSVRYAIQRKRAAANAAFEQARLAAFGAEVGLALTRGDCLEAILERCANAMARFLNAAFAQISIYNPNKNSFENSALAGSVLETAEPPHQPPLVQLDVKTLREGKPVLLKQLVDNHRVSNLGAVQKHELVSYAAYPLVLEEKLVGLMSIFTQQPLSEQIWQEMGSVANGISLCIERKRSEEALDASEDKYRSVVESIKEVIFQMDEFGNWTFLNPAWSAVTGFEVKPTLQTFFLEYVHQEERERNRHIFLQVIERRLDYCRYETRFLTNNGKVRWVDVYAQPIVNGDGTVRGASGSLTDITDRKMAETAIQKLAAFPQVNPNPILEFAADGTLNYSNEAAREMARSLGKADLPSILPPDAGEIACECLARQEKRLREEVRIGGRTLTWSFFPVVASRVVHCYGVDVTDVLNLEAQLRHAQKLESVGQLAAGVAHDFNNILTVIQGYSECLLARQPQDRVARAALKQISEASQRAASLTRQLLTFSRKQVIQPKVLDFNAVLKNLANMLLRLLREDISLEAEYAAELPSIEADAGMMEQIVMNLAVNARDAMPDGGKLRITTSCVDIDEDYPKAHPEARPGHFVCLTVSDTGCGMDPKTMERIFEPFFSTKEVGKGTGLGLATVYGIVKQHQGWIEVDSQVGAGATFKIFFPSASRPLDREMQKQGETVSPRGRETILVVEDEPVVRDFVCEVLKGLDYSVVEAGCGAEALRAWDEFDGQIDLLLTDMVMPQGMTGRELVQHLKKRKPELKVVYTSGYSPEALQEDFSQTETVFLSKPYLPPQLAKIVRTTLDNPGKTQRELVEQV